MSSSVQNNDHVPIVTIGGSAGGLEALTALLQHLPATTGMSFVYIQHLDKRYESNLQEIISRNTAMRVELVENEISLAPDCLYVIPPDKDLAVEDGMIKAYPRQDERIHMPIDRFLISVADNHKKGAVGIILSGAASDGTIGLKAIKAAGGLTFAQDESAKFQGMPKSAILEGVVDMVLPPHKIAAELERLSKEPALFDRVFEADMDEAAEKDANISKVLQLVKKTTGADFAHYKINTIRRRILRRMLLQKLTSLADYLVFLKQHTSEVNQLYADLLINVTTFFRDANAVALLTDSVLPQILKNKSVNDPLRIWMPACSSGEEVYSFAMIILELLEGRTDTAIQIFGTDLSESAIAKARSGIYSLNEIRDVSPKRLETFFTKIDGHYRINKVIRDLCVFAPHNVFNDPPFSRLDLISCCNLLIYLDQPLQNKIMSIFHYALNINGYLLLGNSETIGSSSNFFVPADKKVRLFTRKGDAAPHPAFEVSYRRPRTEEIDTKTRPSRRKSDKEITTPYSLEKVIDNLFLSKYVPPAVVINYNMDILQFRGPSSLFLAPPPGSASLNLLKMVEPDLAFELRGLINQCIKIGRKIQRADLAITTTDNITRRVNIEISPLEIAMYEPLILIVFTGFNSAGESKDLELNKKGSQERYLENELISLREEMKTLLHEQESAYEELQSANEEIVSTNEELQSINEELETSKEEMESTNEELMTINHELIIRNDQLAESHEYTEAVIATIREAVLILDKNLVVKSANSAFFKTFDLKEHSIKGHVLYEIDHNQWDIPKLKEVLETMMPEYSSVENIEIRHSFPRIGEKVLIVDARRVIQKVHKREFILLAIQDVTDQRQNQQLLGEREAWLRNMTDNVPSMIWVAGPDRQYTYLNKTWLAYTGRTLRQEMNNGWVEGIHRDDIGNYLSVYKESFELQKPFRVEYRMKRYDGQYRWLGCTGVPTYSADGSFSGFTGSCLEVHDEKLLNEELEKRVKERTRQLQELNLQLLNSNKNLEQFAYVASHDLQEPLRKILTFSARLLESADEMMQEPGLPYIQKITTSSQRMTQLIDDLLNFSRIEKAAEEFREVDLNQAFDAVLDDFELEVNQKNVKVFHEQLPVIKANPLQIQQLFHNLLSNAIKFSNNNKQPEIRVYSNELPPERIKDHGELNKKLRYWEIVFQDNGIGFSQEFAEQIFTIFHRLHEKKAYAGTGIGLALCRRIAQNHGGLIYAESSEGMGASFHIILPKDG